MFCRLDELGLEGIGNRLEPGRAILACRVVEPDSGAAAAAVKAWRGTRCCAGWPTSRSGGGRRRCWCRSAVTAAPAVGMCGAKTPARPQSRGPRLSRRGLRWALEAIVGQHLTVARAAEGLGVAWNTDNDAVLTEGQRVLTADPYQIGRGPCPRGRRARRAPRGAVCFGWR